MDSKGEEGGRGGHDCLRMRSVSAPLAVTKCVYRAQFELQSTSKFRFSIGTD